MDEFMNRALLFGMVLLLCLTSANPVGLVRLTVVNKSSNPLGIRLDEINPCDKQQAIFYYLSVPKGDSDQPAEKTFTVVRERYTMQVYYIQIYDPVYGWSCNSPTSGTLEANHNTRLVFLKCGAHRRMRGRRGWGSLGARANRRRGEFYSPFQFFNISLTERFISTEKSAVNLRM